MIKKTLNFRFICCFLFFAFILSSTAFSQVDTFSPSHITAGTGSVLTITGSGFGPHKTANNSVYFYIGRASQGIARPLESDYLLWSDTRIEVKVPSGAGDGPIYIKMDNGTVKAIHPWLIIDYDIYNVSGKETKLYDDNGSGGYTFNLHTSLNSNNKAKAAFLNAFETWKCATGVNWKIGEPTSSRWGGNIIRIVDDEEMDVGAAAQTSTIHVLRGNTWYLVGVNITFSKLNHWFKFNSGEPGLYDFESVALHSLGKALNLGVVINQNDVMYWGRQVTETEKRTLNTNDINAGRYMVNLSQIASGIEPPMIPLSPGSCAPAYSFINSFSPTTARSGEVITITGTNFTGATKITFGGVPAASFTVVSPTTITAVISNDGASGEVNVSGPGGVAAATGFIFISKLPQVFTYNAIPVKTYGDIDFDPGVTANTGLPITYTSSNPLVATIVNNKVHMVGAGSAIITATQVGNATYSPAIVNLNLFVSKAIQNIDFPTIPAKRISDPDFDLNAVASSGLEVSFTSSNPSVVSIIGYKAHIVGAGSTTITAIQNGNNNYSAATQVSNSLTISKFLQTITFPNLSAKELNSLDFDPGASASSGLAITYNSSNPAVATIVNNKVHIVGAGSTTITALQVGNTEFASATKEVELVVNKANQTITFPNLMVKNYNDADFDLTATASSGLSVNYRSSNPSVATIIGNKVHLIASGSTTIIASQTGNTNFNAATEVTQILDVVFTLPVSNFTVKSTDVTCKGSNNGAIQITATQALNYTATIIGNNKTTTHPFNSVLALNNLPAGTYNVCITIAGQAGYKQCFDLAIKEPKDLAVYSNLKDGGNTVVLKLEGSNFYRIELNGKVFTTTDQEISLPLINGNNIVKISSDKLCQGIVEKTFITTNRISLYPNPVKDMLYISTGSTESNQAKIEVHSLDGRLVHTSQHISEYGRIGVNLSKLSKGLHVLTLSIGNTKTIHKIIKD
ncbi:T9SS type A sorting domain-containing protein [Pedobacter sp. Hv1]|uniref:T9SS type A sorting domain-containing protein n=1 Tax=Pedobacter sp. Hv1 TaxID=1740090 RepID=UPI0006D8A353|nr:T9SS type A sorting domain-containing protein [Pedobacter sp. Hv1]KQB99358.1 hypothetical protein AQF98_17450 [Pedobacter sp. Hv1]